MNEPQEVVALRIPASQKAWLQRQAKEQDRSMNYIARRLFEREMEAQKEKVA